MMDAESDPGAAMQAALDELWEYAEAEVADHGGPVVIVDWRAPGVEQGQYDELVDRALQSLRVPEDRDPGEPGPR